jgi:hypothetical protein
MENSFRQNQIRPDHAGKLLRHRGFPLHFRQPLGFPLIEQFRQPLRQFSRRAAPVEAVARLLEAGQRVAERHHLPRLRLGEFERFGRPAPRPAAKQAALGQAIAQFRKTQSHSAPKFYGERPLAKRFFRLVQIGRIPLI